MSPVASVVAAISAPSNCPGFKDPPQLGQISRAQAALWAVREGLVDVNYEPQ
jgi:hypothetical protein